MSILTKVFVVILVVFSIAFTSMTVSMVAQTTNWRDTAEKYKQHARTADTNLRHQIAASAAMMASAKDKMRDDLERIHGLEKELGNGRDRIVGLESTMAGANAEKNTLAAMNSALVDQLQVAEVARAAGAAAKVCGAGVRGVVAVWAPPGARGPGRREAVTEALGAAGFRVFPARVDLRGLEVG